MHLGNWLVTKIVAVLIAMAMLAMGILPEIAQAHAYKEAAARREEAVASALAGSLGLSPLQASQINELLAAGGIKPPASGESLKQWFKRIRPQMTQFLAAQGGAGGLMDILQNMNSGPLQSGAGTMGNRLLAAGLDAPVAAQKLGGLLDRTKGMMAKLQELEGMSGMPGIPGSLNLPGLTGSPRFSGQNAPAPLDTGTGGPQPLRQNAPDTLESGSARPLRQNAPGRQIGQADLQSLIAQTPDKTDTDGDGLPDAVEVLLGTDPEREDTDFDRLNDYYEVANGLDPLNADSNGDGLADYLEVTDVPSLDVDGDGIPNAWDPDNDNDGVPDAIDLSPFASSTATAQSHFEFFIKTNGQPTYVSFQLRPENQEHIKLAMSTWDWPSDDKGAMQDRDNSTNDVQLAPMLELSSRPGQENTFRALLPEQSDVEDYGIKIERKEVEECEAGWFWDGECWSKRIKPQDKIYVPLSPVEDYGNKVAFNGRMFWPARPETTAPVEYRFRARLVWVVTGKTDKGDLVWTEVKSIGGLGNENQGGDAVIADINGNGKPDLLLMGIDNPSGANRFWYRIGYDLDASGNPASWSSVVTTGGLGNENQGGGAAVYDIDGNGRPELVLMGIDNPSGANRFWYWIGWNINTAGIPSSWSPMVNAGGPGNENQGGGVAIADINGNGRPELVLMGIDNPDGPNSFWYRIGWDLSTSGNPSSWSEVKASPRILPDNTQGGGVEIADLNGNGKPDLLLMAINNPSGANNFRYLVGWDLDLSGNPASWSPLADGAQIGHFNQGGGAAIADINGDGKLDLLLMGIDNPSGANSFWYRVGWSLESETMALAQYQEKFTLTGLRVEENHGSEASLFYSDDRDQTLAANTVMAYEFLRSQTTLADMPGILTTNNVSVSSSEIRSFSHQDEALAAINSEMMPAVLDALPEGQQLPILAAFEDRAAVNDRMPHLSTQAANFYAVDISQAPVVTSKTLRTVWYDTAAMEIMSPEALLTAVPQWYPDLDQDDLADMMTIMAAWSLGESTVVRVGLEKMEFNLPEKNDVLSAIKMGISAIPIVMRVVGSVYSTVSTFTWVFKFTGSVSIEAGWAAFKYAWSVMSEPTNAAGGVFSRLGNVISGLGLVMSAAIALYAFFQMAIESGWSRVGVFVGALYATIMMVYSTVLWGIGQIPKFGWIIAGLVALADLIVGWVTDKGIVQWLANWLADLFITYTERSALNVTPLNNSVNIVDSDQNGLTVGDRIEFNARISSEVKPTNNGDWGDVDSSYIRPHYELYNIVLGDSAGLRFEKIDASNTASSRLETWETGVWVKPTVAMINFPIMLRLVSDYQFRYQVKVGPERCSLVPSKSDDHLLDTICVEDIEIKTQNGATYGEAFTLYFDVLPANFDDLVDWIPVTLSSTDYDNDGLPNSQESRYYKIINKHSGLGLSVNQGLLSCGAEVVQSPYSDWAPNMQWRIEPSGNWGGHSYSRIIARHSGKFLKLRTVWSPDDLEAGTPALQCERYVPKDELWQLEPLGDGYYKIINYDGHSKGWALGVSGASSSAGGEVAIWPYEDADHFKWRLEAVADDYYRVTAKHSGKTLEVDGGSKEQGANVDQRTYNGGDSQKWQFVPLENGYYKIVAKHSGLGLSVHQGLTNDGANVVQWRYRDTGNMQWWLESLGEGYYKIRAKHSGKELAVTGGSPAEGANVLQWTSQDTDNFKWKLEKVEPGPTLDQWRWDTDGDGLSDKLEMEHGSNPGVADRDADGLPDALEFRLGTDPLKADTDGDGLSDFEEYRGWAVNLNLYGQTYRISVWSDPMKADTDGDGLSDKEEYDRNTNPRANDVDTDGDGLPDALELQIGTDPNTADTDGDGLSDGQEYRGWTINLNQYGQVSGISVWSDPLVTDSDGDGLSDKEEFDLGINPRAADTDGDFLVDADDPEPASAQTYFKIMAKNSGKYMTVGWPWTWQGLDLIQWTLEQGSQFEWQLVLLPDGSYKIVNRRSGLAMSVSESFTQDGATVQQYTYFDRNSYKWRVVPTEDGSHKIISKYTGKCLAVEGDYTNDGALVRQYPCQDSVYFKWQLIRSSEFAGELELGQGEFASGLKSGQGEEQDGDGDGLSDQVEIDGWDIAITTAAGIETIHVTSDPWLSDSDFDGLSDAAEFNLGSNPRAADTDGDGLSDLQESQLGTAIASYDTDGDGLDDGTEMTFGSDPKLTDTDGDGLSDKEEFEFGSNPRRADSDGDGLTDAQEKELGTSLRGLDSDGDLLSDKQEYDLGTDPWNPDSDGDSLMDGEESFYGTNPLNDDTDGDGFKDGEEVELLTDPLNPDSDGDGLTDLQEVEYGTNPLVKDTDNDGINDALDPDTFAPNVEEVFVLYDSGGQGDYTRFIDGLSRYTKVTYGTLEAIPDYQSKPYLILLGRPGTGEGTVGKLIYDLTPEEYLERMMAPGSHWMEAGLEVWPGNKLTIILTEPYLSDYWRVLAFLKSLKAEVLENSISVTYPVQMGDFSIEAREELDVFIEAQLLSPVQPSMTISRYNENTTPHPLTAETGLAAGVAPVGKYMEFLPSENIQSEATSNIDYARFRIYYTALELDRTPLKDGDTTDPGDIDENTLTLYRWDEAAESWVELTAGLDWVNEVGIDTTNAEINGKSYEGYVWADVKHLSLFALAGEVRPPAAGAIPEERADPKNNLGCFITTATADNGSLTGMVRKSWETLLKKLSRSYTRQ